MSRGILGEAVLYQWFTQISEKFFVFFHMQSFSCIGPSLRFPILLQIQGVETFLFVLLTNLKKIQSQHCPGS